MPIAHFKPVIDAFVSQIRAAAHPVAGGLFAVPAEQIKLFGDFLDKTVLPCALVGAGDQQADETSSKMLQKMPIVVKVWFDKNSGTPGATIQQVHSEIVWSIMDAILGTDAKRMLNDKAIETTFAGGGTKLKPETREDPPTKFSIGFQFDTIFRHQADDASIQA